MRKMLFFAGAALLLSLGQGTADTKTPVPTVAPATAKATPTPDTWKFCKDRFVAKYDKFKDATTFGPKDFRGGPRVQSKGGDDVMLLVSATFPGQKYDPQKPVEISIIFSRLDVSQAKNFGQHTGEAKYQDCSTLILIADGQRMDFGTLKYASKTSFDAFTGYNYIDQTMTGSMTLDQLKTLATAKSVEGELCQTELTFRKDEFCVLNTVLNYLQ